MAALRKGLAAKKAAKGKFGPDNNTITGVRFLGILRTGGGEATSEGRAKEGVAEGVIVRRKIFLVEGEHKYCIFYIFVGRKNR